MPRKDVVYRTVVSLAFVVILLSVMPAAYFDRMAHRSEVIIPERREPSMSVAGTTHAPIYIDGDANFSDTALIEGWPGDGSYDAPYIIDGLDISRGGAVGHCISISNTMVNFTISNCNLTGASVEPGAGIFLDNVKNARVVDNLCQQNAHGIVVQGRGSENCVLMNNTCTQNSVSGIQLVASLNISLIRNNCIENYHGIYAFEIMGLSGHCGEYTIASNYCCNNTYGISLGEINVESIGPILNTVFNNNCSANSEDGIRIINSHFSTFTNNSCNGNGVVGINLRIDNNNNMLIENTCNENGQFGIYLDNNVWQTNITDNLCSMNGQYGIYLDMSAGFNNISWNVFSDNLVGNAHDEGLDNVFDYNYWSDYAGADANGDYFGDVPYTFTTNSDPHPLMFIPTPPKWNETPVNQIIEYGTHFVYDLNVTTPGPVIWSMNWTVHLTINNQGIIESIGNLSLGIFGVQVTVTNVYNACTTAKFNVEVVLAFDNNPPGWVVTPIDLSIEYGVGVDLQIHALDRSGIERWTLNDTTHFTLNANYYELGSTARITNKSVLEPASYGLSITVYDTNDNYCSVTFAITVLEVPSITTTPTTTSPTTSITPGDVNPVMTFVFGAGIGGAAVIVMVIVFLRRSS